MKKTELLEKLLKEYNLEEPIPPSIQKKMLKAKKRLAINILKKKKRYSVWLSLILSTYFLARTLGIAISVTQSAVVVIIASVSSAAIITTGGYITVKKVFHDHPQHNEKQTESIDKMTKLGNNTKEDARPPAPGDSRKPVPIQYKVEVIRFKSDEATKKMSNLFEKKVIRQLNQHKGKNTAKLTAPGKQNRKTKHVILGSIVKIGDSYFITAKLMEQRTSVVKSIITEELKFADELDTVAKKIARKLAEAI